MHISSLIHDDIIDNSEYRRGQQSVFRKFGVENAIFGANFLVGRTGRKLA
jgi:geranylgeranyl pyrophosphate synthase